MDPSGTWWGGGGARCRGEAKWEMGWGRSEGDSGRAGAGRGGARGKGGAKYYLGGEGSG